MLREEDRVRLQHMLDACRTALKFVQNRTRSDLDRETMLAFALIHAIEIIGEAANRVTPKGRGNCPDIPWPGIIAMRNRLAHGYFDVDLDRVWDTVTSDIPPLVAVLEEELDQDVD